MVATATAGAASSDGIRAVLDELLEISPEASDRDELTRAVSLNAKLQAFAAHYAVRCSRRGDQLAAAGGARSGFATLLDGNGSARDAKAAGERDRVCTTLPQFDDALAAGQVSAEHVDVLARHTKGLTDDERAAVIERADDLRGAAASSSAWSFDRHAKTVIADIKAKHRPRSDVEELERQRAASSVKRWTEPATGMKYTLLELDPLRDSQLHAKVNARLKTLRRDPANAKLPFAHLKVQAFVDVITGPNTGTGEPEVVVHIDAVTAAEGRHDHTLCETDDGTRLPVDTVRRFCCDAVVYAVFVEPDGSVRRLATLRTPNRAQRRALAALYATCAHPGCTIDITQCKIHHVVWYSRGGPTLLDNLVPLCEEHHHLVHEGGWSLTMTPDREITWRRPDGTVWRVHHSPNRRVDHPPGRQRRQTAA